MDNLLLVSIKYFSKGLIQNEQNIIRAKIKKNRYTRSTKTKQQGPKIKILFIRNSIQKKIIRNSKQNSLNHQGSKHISKPCFLYLNI